MSQRSRRHGQSRLPLVSAPIVARGGRQQRRRRDSRPVRLAILVALPILALGRPGWAQINNYGLLTGINTIPGEVAEFDTRSNAPIGSTITTGGGPQNAVFSPDGRFAYVPMSLEIPSP